MLKAKEHKVADSNIENLGGKDDKDQRAKAASSEKAWKKWKKDKVGLVAWRIEKFKVKHCREAENGQFFNGDSYIVINSIKDPKNDKKIIHDLHYWLGAASSQDEKGTCAYKTVELDDYINIKMKAGDPVQHRECSQNESKLFRDYFTTKGGMRIQEGGIDSGFNIVKPESFKPRLLHLKGKKKNMRIVEVDIAVESLNSGDVFIMDAGLNLYAFQGKGAGIHEKSRQTSLQRQIDDERKGKPEVHVLTQSEEADDVHQAFWSHFLPKDDDGKLVTPTLEKCAELMGQVPDDDGGNDDEQKSELALWQLTIADDGKEVTFKEVATKKLKKSALKSEDVFIVDVGMELYVWVGSKTNKEERSRCMDYATQYLKDQGKNELMAVTRVIEGDENEVFHGFFKGK